MDFFLKVRRLEMSIDIKFDAFHMKHLISVHDFHFICSTELKSNSPLVKEIYETLYLDVNICSFQRLPTGFLKMFYNRHCYI